MGAVEEMMCVVCVSECYRGGIVVMASALCVGFMYGIEFGKGDVCVLSWTRMRRVRRERSLQS